MTKLTLKAKINIFGTGLLATAASFFLIYILLSRTLSLTIINPETEQPELLFPLLFSMVLIAIVSSILLSQWQVKGVDESIVILSAILSAVFMLLILLFAAYISVLSRFPSYLETFFGLELFPGLIPTIIIDFSIFILPHPIFLILFILLIYYISFIIFLSYFNKKNRGV
jgi:hypothetical protein